MDPHDPPVLIASNFAGLAFLALPASLWAWTMALASRGYARPPEQPLWVRAAARTRLFVWARGAQRRHYGPLAAALAIVGFIDIAPLGQSALIVGNGLRADGYSATVSLTLLAIDGAFLGIQALLVGPVWRRCARDRRARRERLYAYRRAHPHVSAQ